MSNFRDVLRPRESSSHFARSEGDLELLRRDLAYHAGDVSFELRDVVGHLDTVLDIGRFRDYGPNGLQVEGSGDVRSVVTGVSASAELISHAVERKADLIVVHHGLVWNPGIATIAGPLARRLKLLLANNISLAAYHLPLDFHPRLGNNAGLADALGLGPERSAFGEVKGIALGVAGAWSEPLARDAAIARVATAVCGGELRFAFPFGPQTVRSVGLCSGNASDLLEAAAAAGCDLFVTGELSERASDIARELQISLVAAGHVATEVFGPMRLAEELRARFPGIDAEFIATANPL